MPRLSALTPLELALLSLLAEHPMHPYEMYSTLLDRKADQLFKVRPGSTYHGVSRLEKAGLIEVLGTERAGNRPERTCYRLTAAGRDTMTARLRELLAEPAQEFPAFTHAVAEAHNLPKAEVIDLLVVRRASRAKSLADLQSALDDAASHDLPERWYLEVRWAHRLMQTEIDWIDWLIHALRTGAMPWTDEEPGAADDFGSKGLTATPGNDVAEPADETNISGTTICAAARPWHPRWTAGPEPDRAAPALEPRRAAPIAAGQDHRTNLENPDTARISQ